MSQYNFNIKLENIDIAEVIEKETEKRLKKIKDYEQILCPFT